MSMVITVAYQWVVLIKTFGGEKFFAADICSNNFQLTTIVVCFVHPKMN